MSAAIIMSKKEVSMISCLVADQAFHTLWMLVSISNMLDNIVLRYLRLAGVFVCATFRSIQPCTELRLTTCQLQNGGAVICNLSWGAVDAIHLLPDHKHNAVSTYTKCKISYLSLATCSLFHQSRSHRVAWTCLFWQEQSMERLATRLNTHCSIQVAGLQLGK